MLLFIIFIESIFIINVMGRLDNANCLADGIKCHGNNNECCSKNCSILNGESNFICLPKKKDLIKTVVTHCSLDKRLCFSNKDCCSNRCLSMSLMTSSGSFCVEPLTLIKSTTIVTINCTPNYKTCKDNNDCCSKNCKISSMTSQWICLAKNLNPSNRALCRTIGKYCIANDDCCSKRCLSLRLYFSKLSYCAELND